MRNIMRNNVRSNVRSNMNASKKIFSKPVAKATVDVLLFLGLIAATISAHVAERSWWSLHCIVGMTWYALMLVHIWQHRRMTKAVLKLNRKILKRNKTTLLTIVAFILITCSVAIFMFKVNEKFVHLHHAVASPFRFIILIHAITKIKQFSKCFS